MMSSRTMDGVRLGDRGNKALSQDVVLLLKTQDAGYLRTVLQQTRLERRSLERSLKLTTSLQGPSVEVLGSESQPSRKIFVNSAEEQFANATKSTARINVEDGGAGSGSAIQDEDVDLNLELANSAADQESRLRRLKALITREEELTRAERELEFQRGKMSNNLGGMNENGVKYKVRERKK
jgi:U3 small nucleolar RNA-associated protein 11